MRAAHMSTDVTTTRTPEPRGTADLRVRPLTQLEALKLVLEVVELFELAGRDLDACPGVGFALGA